MPIDWKKFQALSETVIKYYTCYFDTRLVTDWKQCNDYRILNQSGLLLRPIIHFDRFGEDFILVKLLDEEDNQWWLHFSAVIDIKYPNIDELINAL